MPRAAGGWSVRYGNGQVANFGACTPVGGGCFAPVADDSREVSHKLYFDSTNDVLTLFTDEGRYVYGARWIPSSGTKRYFLSRIEASEYATAGGTRVRATLAYQQPAGCPGASAAGGTAGTPYLATVTTAEGAQLKFLYNTTLAVPGSKVPTECVLSNIQLLDRQSGLFNDVVVYGYDTSGRLSTADFPQRTVLNGGALRQTFSYVNGGSPGFVVTENGLTTLSFTFAADGTVLTQGGSVAGSAVTQWSRTPPVGGCPALTSCAVGISQLGLTSGDGSSTSATLTDTNALQGPAFAFGHRVASTSSSDGASNSWQWAQFPGGLAANTAMQGANGAWAGQSVAPSTASFGGATFTTPLEVASRFSGSSSAAGANALEATNFAWTYGGYGQPVRAWEQLLTDETRASVVPGCGVQARTHRTYEQLTNRLTATFQQGCTKQDINSWQTTTRTIAAFYVSDASGRVLEVHGPCDVAGLTATACPVDAPLTTYEYWPTSAGNESQRLKAVSRFASPGAGGTGIGLRTEYSNYDAWGSPGTVRDTNNGVDTTFTYEEQRVTSRSVGGRTWQYTYEGGLLHAERSPSGVYTVYCHHTGLAGSSCDLYAPFTKEVRARFTSAAVDGSNSSESVEYEYATDGSVRTETYRDGSKAIRRVVTHENDARGNPTFESSGVSGSSGPTEVRAFDTSGHLIALGAPASGAPARCGVTSPGMAPSPLCDAFSVDAMGRTTVLYESPTGQSYDRVEARLTYDLHGDIASVANGCPAGGSCNQPVLSYLHDDFGNVIEVTAPNTQATTGSSQLGTTRMVYNAGGALLGKSTPAIREAAGNPSLAWAYDALGRETSLGSVQQYGGGTQLYRKTWDSDSNSLSYSCSSEASSLTNTQGRLASSVNPVWKSWYGYDAEGRKTFELKVRVPQQGQAFACDFTQAATSVRLAWTYTSNGDVATIRYPHGRLVTYLYGTGGLARRVSGLTSTIYGVNGSSSTATLVSNVTWEPFAGIRGYAIKNPIQPSAAAGQVDYLQGQAANTLNPACGNQPQEAADGTGRVRAISVSKSGSIYRRSYRWQGDALAQSDTCYLQQGAPPLSEIYAYDKREQLTSASMPNWISSGGAYRQFGFEYDARQNRMRTVPQFSSESGYVEALAAGISPDRLVSQTNAIMGSGPSKVDHAFEFSIDGHVTRRVAAVDSSNQASQTWSFDWGEASGATPAHALETVMRAVAINASSTSAAWYNYFYDSDRERQLKVDPLGGENYFFWGGDHQLLEDVGPANTAGLRSVDEYIWLDGRPLAVFRAGLRVPQYGNLHVDERSRTTACDRDGDGVSCQPFFLVTDIVQRPVLVLNADFLISGVGEYQPFGHVNRVTQFAESNNGQQLGAPVSFPGFGQPNIFFSYGGSLNTRVRAHFSVLDTEDTVVWGAPKRDYVYFGDSSGAPLDGNTYAGYHRGDLWTSWVTQPNPGLIPSLWWVTDNSNCAPFDSYCSNGWWPYAGFAVDSYEYQRVQPGAQSYFPALRAAGQYHDRETDLFENWNRFLDAQGGRYLSLEPQWIESSVAQQKAVFGHQMSMAYGYAGNNPILRVDPTGLDLKPGKSCKSETRAIVARLAKSLDSSTDCRCLRLLRELKIVEKVIYEEDVYDVRCWEGMIDGQGDACGHGEHHEIDVSTRAGCSCVAKNIIHELLHADPGPLFHSPDGKPKRDASFMPFNDAESCIQCDGTVVQ